MNNLDSQKNKLDHIDQLLQNMIKPIISNFYISRNAKEEIVAHMEVIRFKINNYLKENE